MLLENYLKTRQYTEQLCRPLEIEDYVPQAADFASPPKWNLAHVTWFFEELILKKFLHNYREFDPQFSFLFNSYYQTVGERALRSQRGIYTRPTVAQVYQYRQYVDEHIKKLLSQEVTKQVQQIIVLGINHEQQHQELLITDLKYVFGSNVMHPVYAPDFNLVADHNQFDDWLAMKQGMYSIGHKAESFCYDNELGCHQVYLPAFQISRKLVTNGEYIDFIEAGAYENFKYWLDDGWSWCRENEISHPLYWKKIDGQWFYYTLAGLKPIDKHAILCHISFYEANAFATWKGLRLPTEFEWEAACHQLDWGKRWEWTASSYLPYPNYQISEGAEGEYNGKFMSNQMVLRGSSVATSHQHSRHTYRNFFYPQMQWQFSGIRLVKDQTHHGR